MDKPWKVICAFVGVFVAGAVFGGFFTLRASNKHLASERPIDVASKSPADVAVEPPKQSPATAPDGDAKTSVAAQTTTPPAARPAPQDRIVPAVMNQMTKRLSPTAAQKEKIRPLIARATEDIQRLTREHWQDTTRVTERMYEDIAALLTPEQRIDLEKMRQESLERVRKAREKQRDEAQAKSNARSNSQTQSGSNPARKRSTVEAPNRSP